MSLKLYFPEQLDQLKKFATSATEVVRCVQIDPEMKPMLMKILAKLDEEPEFPHALLSIKTRFNNSHDYFQKLLEQITKNYEEIKKSFVEIGVVFKPPIDPEKKLKSPAQFIQYSSKLADSLLDNMGSIVLVIDPEEVANKVDFKKSIEFLADKTTSRWLKYIVFDSRANPVLEGLSEENDHVGMQTFYLSPEEIENRAREDLNLSGALEPGERRKYLGLIAGFAYARKEYEDAIKYQSQWVTEAKGNAEPSELANALYNLGNTYHAKGDFAEATEVYCQACDICIENELNSLAPFVYTNLGINLHRQGDFESAFDSLGVARDMYKAQKQRPGEAHVVDCLAQIYALDGENEKAEETWLYALSIYEGITSSLFKDLRESGINDISAKLEQFYKDTNQESKIQDLQNKDN
jgi:tetratricopeptide (TPR) repeat protein